MDNGIMEYLMERVNSSILMDHTIMAISPRVKQMEKVDLLVHKAGIMKDS